MAGQQQSLREAIKQRIGSDPQSVIRALESAGVKLTQEERSSITQGRLDKFSDSQLNERFSAKVLGILGIRMGQAQGQGQGQGQQNQGKTGAPQGREAGQQGQQHPRREDKKKDRR